jgi:hypothetical protein
MWCAQDHISRSIPPDPRAAPPDSRVTRNSQVRISAEHRLSRGQPTAAVVAGIEATVAIPPTMTNSCPGLAARRAAL